MPTSFETIKWLSESSGSDRNKSAPQGSMEYIDAGQPYLVLIDCAQTPHAFENVLRKLKTSVIARQGRLLVLFGCGGNRDRGIRSQMGEIASDIADFIILTDDNPGSEFSWGIIEDILQGFNQHMKKFRDFIIIQDRKNAISYTIRHAKPNDIVILAGKGHETGQVLKSKTIPFDDREQAISAISSSLKSFAFRISANLRILPFE